MKLSRQMPLIFGLLAVFLLGLVSPRSNGYAYAQTGTSMPDVTLTFAAYSVPREAYGQIIKAFQKYWLDKTGQKVTFQESYQGSGTQSRNIVNGFKADVTALSVEPDVTRIAAAKLITHDWQKTSYRGMVSDSVTVLAVRPGNPKNIHGWADIAKPGIEVITPNPATSGGAQWNLLAAYGAAKRGKIEGVEQNDENALKFIGNILKNVSVFDKDGRESFLTFERGVGDVAITYENEVYAGLAAGGQYEIIYPDSTILIENPATYIDVYVDANGTRPVAEAFVQYLLTPDAQHIFADYGFRPVVAEIAKEDAIAKKFPPIKDLFTIDEFGGWSKVSTDLFGDKGAITKLLAQVQR